MSCMLRSASQDQEQDCDASTCGEHITAAAASLVVNFRCSDGDLQGMPRESGRRLMASWIGVLRIRDIREPDKKEIQVDCVKSRGNRISL